MRRWHPTSRSPSYESSCWSTGVTELFAKGDGRYESEKNAHQRNNCRRKEGGEGIPLHLWPWVTSVGNPEHSTPNSIPTPMIKFKVKINRLNPSAFRIFPKVEFRYPLSMMGLSARRFLSFSVSVNLYSVSSSCPSSLGGAPIAKPHGSRWRTCSTLSRRRSAEEEEAFVASSSWLSRWLKTSLSRRFWFALWFLLGGKTSRTFARAGRTHVRARNIRGGTGK